MIGAVAMISGSPSSCCAYVAIPTGHTSWFDTVTVDDVDAPAVARIEYRYWRIGSTASAQDGCRKVAGVERRWTTRIGRSTSAAAFSRRLGWSGAAHRPTWPTWWS